MENEKDTENNSYKDELSFVTKAKNDSFPDFLFKPAYNDFGSEYYYLGTSTDPLVVKARSLRRKYGDYFSYIQALQVWQEYMDLLIEKYGGMSVIKNALKEKRKAERGDSDADLSMYDNIIEDIIPERPIPKNKKSIREFIRAGVVPSRQLKEEPNYDAIKENTEAMYPVKDTSYMDVMDMFKKPPKHIRKALERASGRIAARNRKDNIYQKYGNNNGADFIVEYMNNASKGYYDTKGEFKEMSLSDIVKEDKHRESMLPELYEDELLANTSVVSSFGSNGNRMMNRRELQQIEIAKNLYSIGIDVTGTMAKNMDKKAIKIIRRSIGALDSQPMTKKELKKFKKDQKKEQKRLETQRDSDALLSEVLLKNKFSFNKSGSTLNFKLKDVIRNDD